MFAKIAFFCQNDKKTSKKVSLGGFLFLVTCYCVGNLVYIHAACAGIQYFLV